MARKSRDILPASLDSGQPAPATTPGSDPTTALRSSAREVKSTPPAPTDQSSTQIDPRRELSQRTAGPHADGLGPGMAI